jgi:transaldolase
MKVLKKRSAVVNISDLQVKLFADGADKNEIIELNNNPLIKGFTTNPTLMRQAGINDYSSFAIDILSYVQNKPISFEVFSDDFIEMRRQAKLIATWADNVNVKIPITNTKGQNILELVKDIIADGVKVNVTAMMTIAQLENVLEAMQGCAPSYVSLFAGRIADTGIDPIPIIAKAVDMVNSGPNVELIWASPRELLNIVQASDVGCHIITVTHNVLKKMNLLGKDLNEFSLETVKMFHNDALNAGYTL